MTDAERQAVLRAAQVVLDLECPATLIDHAPRQAWARGRRDALDVIFALADKPAEPEPAPWLRITKLQLVEIADMLNRGDNTSALDELDAIIADCP